MIILRNKRFSNREKLNKLGWKTDEDIRKAVKGTEAEKKVNKILNKSAKDMKEAAEKLYSKQDREVVPPEIAKKARKEGVVQKKPNGKWGIISFKTNPPTWWSAEYDSEESAKKGLSGYFVNKRK